MNTHNTQKHYEQRQPQAYRGTPFCVHSTQWLGAVLRKFDVAETNYASEQARYSRLNASSDPEEVLAFFVLISTLVTQALDCHPFPEPLQAELERLEQHLEMTVNGMRALCDA
ncbi:MULTISPECIES: hypothetical protein [Pseudomonas]|uniref:Uncharacterized protein n=2 Tax=Pseudomonas TaxID=286 RepID=A0A2X2D054_PSELU|nr:MULTISPECIES: hypothetical protein [Pseudomonas]ENA34334.1 hypothetical protein HMPREF1487_05988 [Pseudomonas sp. HPB0071]MBF8641191.1 hypothetical protein [Pseudomonas zeshuii]MBW5413048.1 hypothetical protein [Pseudomonas sp. MAG002Y]MDN3236919.1 hypothetical protein [Pseudomonas sp. WAC2]RRW49093.1 hypothetical protein EGJ50_07820 [Pseudomonas luteola]